MYMYMYFHHSSDKSGLKVADWHCSKCRIPVLLRYKCKSTDVHIHVHTCIHYNLHVKILLAANSAKYILIIIFLHVHVVFSTKNWFFYKMLQTPIDVGLSKKLGHMVLCVQFSTCKAFFCLSVLFLLTNFVLCMNVLGRLPP